MRLLLGVFVLTGCNAIFPLVAPDAALIDAPPGPALAQRAYLKASNPGPNDQFGHHVAISADGSTLAVGAPSEDSAARGIDGDQADDNATDAGAVYVFTRSGASWEQQAYLKASNADLFDSFGVRVSLSADGSTLAVGATGEDGLDGLETDNSATEAGAVYVFVREESKWTQQAYVKASNPGTTDHFGITVELSGDGATLAVGAIFEDSRTVQTEEDWIDSGAVYVFAREGAGWIQQALLKGANTDPLDYFGWSVSLSHDGSTLAVGALAEDGDSVGVNGPDSNTANDAGAVYAFTRTDALWTQEAYIKSSNSDGSAQFGVSVDLSTDGTLLAVGAHLEDGTTRDSGAVYVFARTVQWAQQAYLKAAAPGPSDLFGVSVAFSTTSLVIGARLEDSGAAGIDGELDESAMDSGAAYIFRPIDGPDGPTWVQSNFMKASNPDSKDEFGDVVTQSVDGTIVTAAKLEDSNAIGVDGNAANDDLAESGAVYVFEPGMRP